MKKACYVLGLLFLLSQPLFAQTTRLQSIDITSGPGTSDVLGRKGPESNPEILREIVTTGTSSVLATIKVVQSALIRNLDLGDIRVEVLLQVLKDNKYEAKFIVSFEEKNGNLQTAELSSDQSALRNSFFSEKSVDLLVQEMNSKMESLFQKEQELYGDGFLEAVRVFTEEYIRGVMDTSKQVIDSMIERNEKIVVDDTPEVEFIPVEKTTAAQRVGQGSTYDPTATTRVQASEESKRKKMDSKDQKQYHREEVLNIRPEEFDGRIILMPEYLTATSFDLYEKDNPSPEDDPIAHIQYFVAIVPTPYGQYQTTFILGVDYRLGEKGSYTKIMIHGREINEETFFPKWRDQFLKPALQEFINAGNDAKNKDAKIIFAKYLEPFMFDEYYDFLPLFTKAKVVFDEPATQDKLARELKKYQEAAKAYAQKH